MKDEKKGQVVFRRIGGRVIPIRVKSQDVTAKQIKGAASVAAGGVAAAAGGSAAHSLLLKAATYENMARLTAQSASGAKKAAKFMLKSRAFHAGRNFAILGGALAGAGLINKGLKLLGAKEGKKTKTPEGISVPASFALASTVAGAAYYGNLIRPKTTAAIKKVFELARGRKTFEFIFKGK